MSWKTVSSIFLFAWIGSCAGGIFYGGPVGDQYAILGLFLFLVWFAFKDKWERKDQ